MKNIFLMRHAEKPDGQTQGVDEMGANSAESLIPRGWQRAGALAIFFAGPGPLPAPDQIYAAAPDKIKVAPHEKTGSRSARPLQTVTPLAAKLSKTTIVTHTKGDEPNLAQDITRQEGTTLVCWQHEAIPQIAKLIAGGAAAIPESWPPERFDVVWTLTQTDAGQPWIFGQVCQQILSGDRSDPIAIA
jgi:hypothetical protein